MTDIAGDTTTTAVATIGAVASSAIDTIGDHDWYKVTLSAGQTITITLIGGGNLDAYLSVYDPSGTIVLASNDDIVDGVNQNSRVTFTASSAGTYFIDVGAFQNQSTGTYDLFVEPSPAPVFSNDQIAFQLTNGYWGGDVHHWAVTQGGTLTVNISTLTAAEQTLARAALQEWTDIIGVHFQEVSTGGQIVFSDAEDTSGKGPIAQTDANWSSNGIISSAHIQISQSWVNTYGTSLYSYSFQSYVHEIGHALGLGHGGEYNSTASYPTDALFANDAWSTTIMSYFDQQENSYFANKGFSRLYAVTPMDADILAMQSLYGLSTTTRTGDTVYGYNSNAGGVYDASAYPRAALAIFDSGGNDTLDYSHAGVSQLLNLNPETFSNVNGFTGNLTIARGVIIENAIGGSAADTIIGNSANNVLTGNLGADTLTGGAGNDTFKDTEAGHSGDTITDFHAGDTILFTDAALAGFAFSLSGNVLTYTGGSLTLNGVVNGTFTASAAAAGGVQFTETLKHHAHNDFSGDGRSDILWRNDAGVLTDWVSTGTGFAPNTSANGSFSVPLNWHVVGTGDFNGDGHTDILWQNDSGVVTDWLGTSGGGFTPNTTASASATVPLDWHVVGVGDFNGDGIDDILWHNDNGTTTDWFGTASGGFSTANNWTGTPPTNWHVVGTGDFNGDGLSDILWRNDAGITTDWLAKEGGGFTPNNDPSGSASVPLNWTVAGTGDFNGDGITDILWRNDTGVITDWLGNANGGFTPNTNASASASVPLDWHVAAVGDFNGDGIDDIVWHNDNGTTTDWFGTVNGGFSTANNWTGTPPTNWHVQDPLF